MIKPVPMENLRFGRLLVLHFVDSRNKKRRFMCRCDCGNEKIVAGTDLRYGGTKSCGCLRLENSCIKKNKKVTHEQTV